MIAEGVEAVAGETAIKQNAVYSESVDGGVEASVDVTGVIVRVPKRVDVHYRSASRSRSALSREHVLQRSSSRGFPRPVLGIHRPQSVCRDRPLPQ